MTDTPEPIVVRNNEGRIELRFFIEGVDREQVVTLNPAVEAAIASEARAPLEARIAELELANESARNAVYGMAKCFNEERAEKRAIAEERDSLRHALASPEEDAG